MESVWMEDTKIRMRKPLPGDMEVQAVVIGAGLAGILTAYYLKQAGIRAIVLEADRIGSGQTKNTTAKITSQHNLIYDRMIRTFGRLAAGHYASANEGAIREYERLILEKGIACGFVRCPACLYSGEDAELLKREAEAAQSLGIKASFGTDCEIPVPVEGVTRFEGQARFHPLRFLAALAEEVEVYEQTKVLKAEGKKVETARGSVTAEHIVFTAHFPFINVPGYYFARMYQERSYVLALDGAGELECMYLGIDRDGLSLRSWGNLLLLGGGSHRTGVNGRNRWGRGCRYGALRDRAREIYPGCIEAFRWSAQDCMTLDGLPYVGRFSRRRPDWYVATGFGKWGMTTAMVSARILTALIRGQVSNVSRARRLWR
ncbi:MAG: FAD-binding oxidoreductase [Lachnospiraceae bacterium]|nr:FAD-binding oxidoreductase [Lachnospiraceae bacterium]